MSDWPFTKSQAPASAPRGGGGLNVNGGGGVTKPKSMPYDPPKNGSSRVDTDPGKGTNHGMCGTQGRH